MMGHLTRGGRVGEEDISTEPPAPEQDARVPSEDAHAGWPECAAAPENPGSAPAGRGLGGLELARSESGRLTTSADFARAYREGRRFAGEIVVLYFRGGERPLRIGVTAGRRLGGAVQRNRAKRRLREAAGRLKGRLSGGGDVVLAARSRALSAPFLELVAELERLCAAGRLLRRDRP